ncbi:MAG: DNA repair and recombination protein RadB, partial [Candidatus Aenigmarchaeota archaeon]|nr:DNA repair and recombination protein RadB [Candidatus Aenigmarchaeota archaeon]
MSESKFIIKKTEEQEKFKSGCGPIDSLLLGGLEKTIITNIYGPSGVGKTNITIQLAVSCIKSGKKAVIIDTEGGISVERFVQMYNKEALKDLFVYDARNFLEQQQAIMELKELIKKENIGLIAIDSLVSLYRLHMHNDKAQEANQKLSIQLATLATLSREHNIPVIVTNQVYSDFETGDIELVGGDIPKYASKCLIRIEKKDDGKRKATIIKHRSIPEGKF